MESIRIIGKVQSSLKDLKDCPLQEFEGAPTATVTIDAAYWPALLGLKPGDKILLLTWLHKSNRQVLTTKPRNNPNAATTGVFATRSPERPNPIGLHEAEILDITGSGQLKLSNLEVLDGTPVIDIKPVL